MIKFSICIANYNSSKYIEKLLHSIYTQTYKKYEVIIVDDISTDNSVKIIKKLLRDKDKLVVNTTKRLNGGTRNECIKYATGDYIIMIDSDDWLIDNNVLSDLVKHIEDNDYPDIVYTGYKMILEDKIQTNILNITDLDSQFHNGFAASWLKVVKRDLYIKYPFPEGTLFEDRIQQHEMVLNGKPSCSSLGRATHCWNRLNENATTFNPKWSWYRFEYCGELFRLINNLEDSPYRNELINELKYYLNSLVEMVNEL